MTAEHHHRHRDVTGGWLRPAVFGAMDGLVSNFALIAGVAGGSESQKVVLLAGLAGLAAGAFSMAAGEYISVASQSELAEAEIEVERLELARHPASEQRELAEVFESRGVDPETAAEVARQLSRDPDEALQTHAKEEIGVAPGELPSPLLAAVSSFLSFAVGALLPVLPYLLGATSLWPAAAVAALGLFAAGALVSRVTTRAWWFGGLRQLAFGAAAAAITYVVGALIGTNGV
ncbi:VIT1/CCC1 transporter family protein [Actinomadura sp. WMMB 499]|uniref:VIT1/CCC1 transporter family protein n=1 Tax=Actinomadura sp. WMMB 499 TaxID=1219491 RepID=UPI0020C76B52|nr:VIT1/CCC1 transporter family protein [Actinomadura sp. WMMB 499]